MTRTKYLQTLLPPNAVVPGIDDPISNLNGITVGPDGRIYFTSMYVGFDMSEGILGLLSASDPSGRVFQYDPKTGETTLLMDKYVVISEVRKRICQ